MQDPVKSSFSSLQLDNMSCDVLESGCAKSVQIPSRQSIDYGYDSMLSCTTISSSVSSKDSFVFSQPSTPVKQPTQPTIQLNSSIHNHSYVADVNGMYLATIRNESAAFQPSCSSTYQSPFKLGCSSFSHYSASNSNSPVKMFAQSPKFLNTDSYLSERDGFKAKLLRSPAFKLNSTGMQHERPSVKSFSSRFEVSAQQHSSFGYVYQSTKACLKS